jgi:hypothetical protein
MRPSNCCTSEFIGLIVAMHGTEQWKEDHHDLDSLIRMIREVNYLLKSGISWITDEEDMELAQIVEDLSNHITSLKDPRREMKGW